MTDGDWFSRAYDRVTEDKPIAILAQRFGQLETKTSYNLEWVNAIREVIPSFRRRWDGKVWTFDYSCYQPVKEITVHYFGVENVVDETKNIKSGSFVGWEQKWDRYLGRPPRKPPVLFGQANPWQVLFVRQDAPWEVIEAAYKALAKVYHPDMGGTTEQMQVLNASFSKLKDHFGR